MSEKNTDKEIMIERNGKPIFAVRINPNGEGDASYVFIENGDIKFASSWLKSISPFNLSNETHRLAKEIFTIGLQAAVKTKIYELKQLESILSDLDLQECLGNVMVDNTKLLLEVKEKVDNIVDEVKPAVESAITENIKPIVRVRKKAKESEE